MFSARIARSRFIRLLTAQLLPDSGLPLRIIRDGCKATGDRLSDKHVALLIKKCVLAAGIRADLPQAERLKLFSGHSLRAGLATSANVDDRYIQKQLGHASPEMTRRYRGIETGSG